MNQARQEAALTYNVESEDHIIARALEILRGRMIKGVTLNSPSAVREFLTVKLSGLEHEVFGVVYLNSQNVVIEYEELFRGTLTQTSVYPREVAKGSLLKNAAAVILVHNHPSGTVEPSRADELLTQTLKSSLQLVDVRVLDHIIVGQGRSLSMAERGLI
jgi:DNA repair protein RadC